MGRTPCCDKNGLKKGPWTPEEDHKLSHYIQQHGPGNWRNLPKMAGLQRCGKSCRLRWTNYLRPDIKRGRFTFEEEETIIQLHSVLGNKWSAIAARLPGRTDNEIKNYWNTHIRKRLIRTGIDPVTHAPRLDLSSLLNSAQLNLSNLLGLQTLVNPMAMKLLATLLSPENQNPENLLQKFQENQLLNSPFENQTTPLPQYNPFPNISTSNASCSSYQNQLPNMHENMDHFSLQENSMPSDASYLCEENCGLGTLGQMSSDFTENTILHSLNNDHNNLNNQNFGFDSVFSTPLSASPLDSSSTFINSACTEDEKESYCSNLMKFEIPEGFDFDDFL